VIFTAHRDGRRLSWHKEAIEEVDGHKEGTDGHKEAEVDEQGGYRSQHLVGLKALNVRPPCDYSAPT
jgi:hypothetical protein